MADKAAGESWIAIGDAAFAPDPLSGKGIEFGIASATLGAQMLLSEARYGARREYDDWIYEYATEHEQMRAFHLSGAVGTA